MKIYRQITRFIILILTAVFGVTCGLFMPLLLQDIEAERLAEMPSIAAWIIFALIGFLIPCVLFNLHLFKTSAIFSVSGTFIMLYIHSLMSKQMDGGNIMYLSQMFITIFTVVYAIIVTFKKHGEKVKIEEKAPSILGED